METNHSELRSSSGIYRARCAAALTSRVERYIDAVDSQFEVLKRCFGMEPQIQRYQVEFAGEMTCYKGSGEIAISANDQNLDCNQPECFEGGLVFETIHCFLEPLRHPPHGIKYPRIGGNRLGESFSTIHYCPVVASDHCRNR